MNDKTNPDFNLGYEYGRVDGMKEQKFFYNYCWTCISGGLACIGFLAGMCYKNHVDKKKKDEESQ